MADVLALVIPKEKPMEGEVLWRKRQALHIAAQLPENREAALAVLDYTRELIDGFLVKGT